MAALKINPGEVLPAEGVTQVLILAATTHPVTALLLVAIIICFAIWCSAWSTTRWKYYDVLKSPEAAKAITELKKMEQAHKKAMAKFKKGN